MDLFNQITRTKVILPRRRPDLLSRQRLINLVYDLLDYRLTIVTAPPGYGKTSLLIDVAHQIELPVCWYALDALDQDPQRFITHFAASINQQFPQVGYRTVTVLKNAKGKLNLDQLVTTLVNEIYDNITEYFVIVMDDYHLIDSNEEVNYFVNQFVQQASENCHMAIASRSMLPLPDLILMAVRSQTGGLSFEELAFRVDEVQSLMSRNYNSIISETEAEQLLLQTEGWITGLLLSSEIQRKYNMTDRLRLTQSSGVSLYRYLAQQVLDQQPEGVRNFLLRTSLLEEFDANLCKAVFGQTSDWSTLINTVLQNNLFVLRVGDQEVWLRYHHLFRDFLQTQLDKEYPGDKNQILRRLAKVYVERQEWEKAHDLYRRLNDIAHIAQLIKLSGLYLIRIGRHKILTEWLDNLPIEALERHSFLLALRGYLTLTITQGRYSQEQGMRLLDKAIKTSHQTGDISDLAQSLVWRAGIHNFLTNYQASLIDANEALKLAGQDRKFRSIQAEALRLKGMGLYRLGQLNNAIHFLEQALSICDELDDREIGTTIRLELGIAYVATGAYTLAETVYNSALEYWHEIGNINSQSSLLNNIGVLYHQKGDYERAIRSLEKAIIFARQSRNSNVEALALTSIGDLYLDLDAFEVALDIYDQAYEIAQNIDYGFLLFYIELAKAPLYRLNNPTQARRLLDRVRPTTHEKQSDYRHGLYYLEKGKLFLAEDKLSKAKVCLEESIKYFDNNQLVEMGCAHIYLAITCQGLSDKQSAYLHLKQALFRVSTLESWHPLVICGREAKYLLENFRGDLEIGTSVSRLLKEILEFERSISQIRRQVRRQVTVVDFAPPRLFIQALGQIKVTIDGKDAVWQTKAARDLLFCLLEYPNGLTKETISDIFWPDSTPRQLKEQFKVTIRRLRQAVGSDSVLHISSIDRYTFNWNLDYEYDVETFWEKIEQTKNTAIRSKDKITVWRQAIDLYKGDYLLGVNGTWVWPDRERLSRAYEKVILHLVSSYLESGSYDLALEYCQLALRHNIYLEQAHRLAMQAYAGMGNRAAIIHQFEQCCELLQTEIGTPPSPQTEALYNSLIH